MIPAKKLALRDFTKKDDYNKSLTKRLNDYLEEVYYGDL